MKPGFPVTAAVCILRGEDELVRSNLTEHTMEPAATGRRCAAEALKALSAAFPPSAVRSCPGFSLRAPLVGDALIVVSPAASAPGCGPWSVSEVFARVTMPGGTFEARLATSVTRWEELVPVAHAAGGVAGHDARAVELVAALRRKADK